MEENVIILTDEGQDTEFELITTEENGKVYAILKPLEEDQAYIFIMENDEDGNMELFEIGR